MNKEVLAIRHERLEKYYDACYEEYVHELLLRVHWDSLGLWTIRWDRELRARGLALVRDRD